MAQYRNTPANHAIRYPLFEHVVGDFHERRLVVGGTTGDWLATETRQAMVGVDGDVTRVIYEEIPLTPLVSDFQQITRTRPRYISRDPVVPSGAYRVEMTQHHFSYDGNVLPAPADNEAVLYHGGNCVGWRRTGEPVAVVKFNPNLTELPDPYQRAVVQDESSGQWHAPESPEYHSLMKGYIDLMTEMVHNSL